MESVTIMKSYVDYLGEIEFVVLDNPDQLTEDMLKQLENKKGFVINGEYEVYVTRKFEPMQILNQFVIMEHTETFNVIDMFGMIMYQGTINEVIEYVEGFYSEEVF